MRAFPMTKNASGRKRLPYALLAILLVPMHDENGDLVNVQRIDAAGVKRFIMGGARPFDARTFHIDGASRTVLAEGYANWYELREATGDTVVLAFSAGHCLLWPVTLLSIWWQQIMTKARRAKKARRPPACPT